MSRFEISRSVTIRAPREHVHALVDHLPTWEEWSPWEALDPAMRHEYTGPERGTGATHHWVGNRKAGEGTMQITESTLDHVTLDLRFAKPMKAHHTVVIGLVPVEETTEVTWTMTGEQGLIGRAFFAVFGMEKALGRDFDRGLTHLKELAER